MSKVKVSGRRDAMATVAIGCVALLVATEALAPFAARFRDHLAPNLQDPLFNLYLMSWGSRQMALGLPDFWNAGFFFPEQGVVALSDHMVGPAAMTWVLGELGLGPAASYNIELLLSYPLAAMSVFLLLRRTGLRRESAFLGAMAFAFAPFRWLHLEHLPILWIPALALTIWAWDRLLERPAPMRAMVFLVFYALHMTGGLYLAYMIHLPLVAVTVARWPQWSRNLDDRVTRWSLFGAVLGASLSAYLTFRPYLEAAVLGYRRTEGDMAIWGATLLSFLTPSRLNRYFLPEWNGLYRFENALFPGIAVMLALVFMGLRMTPRWAARVRRARRPSLLAAGAALAISALLLGDLATWTNREFVVILGWPLRIRGYSRPALLLAIGVIAAWLGYGPSAGSRHRLSSRRRLRVALLLQGVAAFALSLPVVAAPASRLIPGLLSIRAPSRFALFALIWGALLLGSASSFVARRVPPRWRVPGILGIGLIVLLPELAPRPVEWHTIGRPGGFPAVYRELARRGLDGPVAELPFARGDRRSDLLRMWHSTLHWNPTSAGYSGYEPAISRDLRQADARENPRQLVARLRNLGFAFVIEHEHDLPRGTLGARSAEIAAAIQSLGGELLWEGAEDRLFALPARERTPR